MSTHDNKDSIFLSRSIFIYFSIISISIFSFLPILNFNNLSEMILMTKISIGLFLFSLNFSIFFQKNINYIKFILYTTFVVLLIANSFFITHEYFSFSSVLIQAFNLMFCALIITSKPVFLFSLSISLFSLLLSLFFAKHPFNLIFLQNILVIISLYAVAFAVNIIQNSFIKQTYDNQNFILNNNEIFKTKFLSILKILKENNSYLLENKTIELLIIELEKSAKEITSSKDKINNEISDFKTINENISNFNLNFNELNIAITDKRNELINLENNIKLLASSSKEIMDVTETIKSISQQIALLSLNASIESARAGEFGQGFAVVAEEIGNLASNSSDAVKGIEKKVLSLKETADQIKETATIVTQNFSGIQSNIQSLSENNLEILSNFNTSFNNFKNENISLESKTNNLNYNLIKTIKFLTTSQNYIFSIMKLKEQVPYLIAFINDIKFKTYKTNTSKQCNTNINDETENIDDTELNSIELEKKVA